MSLTWEPVKNGRFIAALFLVSLMASAFAVAFREALREAMHLLYGVRDIISAVEALSWWQRVLLPVGGGLLAGAVGAVAARRAGGHGVAEIMEAVSLGRGQPSSRVALWKGIGAFIAMLTGGSIGREGPIVQFGSGVGAAWGRRLEVSSTQTRTLIAAGTAAGFAAAYNTPIAAALFVMEIVTGVFSLPVLLPVLLASSIATLFSRLVHGEGPLYGARDFFMGAWGDLVGCLLVGAVAALFGVAFMWLLAKGEQTAKRLSLPRPLRGALGGLGVGLIAIFLPEVVGNGAEGVYRLLDSRVELSLLLLLLFAKPLATVFTVSGGIPGGVFTPSLFLGAALGGIIGSILHTVSPALFPASLGAYAMVGMAGVLAATTHAPLMSAVMLVELSGDYRLLIPLFLSVTVALAISRRLYAESIYTEELNRRGIAWRRSPAERLAQAITAKDILQKDPLTLPPQTPITEALSLLLKSQARALYVISNGEVTVLGLYEALRAKEERPACQIGEVAQQTALLSPEDALPTLNEKLWFAPHGELPVVEASPFRFCGVVNRRDLLGALDREVLQRDVLLTRLVWFEGQHEATDYLELPRGQRVELIAPPDWMLGSALDCFALRKEFRVMVLSIRQGLSTSSPFIEPTLSYQLAQHDRLLVVGDPDCIEAFRLSTSPRAQGGVS